MTSQALVPSLIAVILLVAISPHSMPKHPQKSSLFTRMTMILVKAHLMSRSWRGICIPSILNPLMRGRVSCRKRNRRRTEFMVRPYPIFSHLQHFSDTFIGSAWTQRFPTHADFPTVQGHLLEGSRIASLPFVIYLIIVSKKSGAVSHLKISFFPTIYDL